MFTGYSLNHREGVFRVYNLQTQRIIIARDVTWLDVTYGQYTKRIEQQQKDTYELEELEVESQNENRNDESEREGQLSQINPKLRGELRRLHAS